VTLYAYSKIPINVLMSHEDVLWCTWYVNEVAKINPKARPDFLEAQKMCALGFARAYGLMDEWKHKHSKINIYPPFFDFEGHGHKLRIISVPMREDRNLGTELRGRVFDKDYARGHTGYVLAGWYPPYVDIVGWMPRDEVIKYKGKWWYELEESACKPMSSLRGYRLNM